MRAYGRLRRASEIAFVRRRGRTAGRPTVSVYAADAASASPRLAITVSKAVGNAVTRNRVRRRIRGALETLPAPPAGRLMLVVAKPAAASVAYGRLAADLAAALERLVPRA